MRREWIEITYIRRVHKNKEKSPSMRREWIEIPHSCFFLSAFQVSLHAEGVD